MSEEVNDARWQELSRWAEEEWVGGGWLSKSGEDLKFFAATEALSVNFKTYKLGQEPRTLYQIVLEAPFLGRRASLIFTLTESQEAPDTLEEFLAAYFKYAEDREKHNPGYRAGTETVLLRGLRKDFKAIQGDPGYKSLAEVYDYVITQLRQGITPEELHTDTGAYDEGLSYAGSSLNEAPMKRSKKGEEKLLRTLALFLRLVKAFDPDFRHWAQLGGVWITADNPVWKTGGGGILKVADDVNAYFPLTVSTNYTPDLPINMGDKYSRDIQRVVDIKRARFSPDVITNFRGHADAWTGPAFLVQTNYRTLYEATRSLRFRFADPYAVPSVESLAGVHSFKTVTPAQLSDVEAFTRAAEEMGLDNPVGRAAAIRQGTMGYADSYSEHRLAELRRPEIREKVNEALYDFISIFSVEPHELHTDTGVYDESVVSEDLNLSLAQIEFAMAKWNAMPDSKAEEASPLKSGFYVFSRSFALKALKLSFAINTRSGRPFRVNFVLGNYNFDDLSEIPDPLADFFIAALEDSEARARLNAVKPATAAHWQKQFLLGINLEKKVPEEAFPAAPVAALPAYFDKFRAPTVEADLHLVIDTDLSLLGE